MLSIVAFVYYVVSSRIFYAQESRETLQSEEIPLGYESTAIGLDLLNKSATAICPLLLLIHLLLNLAAF